MKIKFGVWGKIHSKPMDHRGDEACCCVHDRVLDIVGWNVRRRILSEIESTLGENW